jgi:hypothetical protein
MRKMNRRVRAMEQTDYKATTAKTIIEYATENNLTESSVRYRLATRRLYGYKIFSRWYVMGDRNR